MNTLLPEVYEHIIMNTLQLDMRATTSLMQVCKQFHVYVMALYPPILRAQLCEDQTLEMKRLIETVLNCRNFIPKPTELQAICAKHKQVALSITTSEGLVRRDGNLVLITRLTIDIGYTALMWARDINMRRFRRSAISYDYCYSASTSGLWASALDVILRIFPEFVGQIA